MNNKIFLTSMLAVLVAWPAVADTIAPGTGTEDCIGTPIGDITSGTVTYTAQWTPDECMITLDPNGGTASSPSTLYTTFGVGAYLESARTSLMTNSTNGLTTPPTGATVTTTYNTNAPTNPRTSQQYTLSSVSPSSSTRAFTGFFSAATGGVKYISETSPYYILGNTSTTGTGAAVAADIAKDNGVCPTTTWYAQWDCATRAIADPYAGTLTGYQTDGEWYNAQTGGNIETSTCISADQTLYLHWTPKTYTVTYDCNGGTSSVQSLSNTATYDSPYTFWTLGNTCSYAGHTPSGWVCKTTPGDVVIDQTLNAQYWQVDSNVICTAQWGTNTITLQWYVGEDNVTTSLGNSPTCTYGTTGTITVNDPTPDRGYSFAGWEVVGTQGN